MSIENENTPAMPIGADILDELPSICVMESLGFTKSEQVVLDLMCALVASRANNHIADITAEIIATDAARLAKAYFKEVEE